MHANTHPNGISKVFPSLSNGSPMAAINSFPVLGLSVTDIYPENLGAAAALGPSQRLQPVLHAGELRVVVVRRAQCQVTPVDGAVSQARGSDPRHGPLRSPCGERRLELGQVSGRGHGCVRWHWLAGIAGGCVSIPCVRHRAIERLLALLKLRQSHGQRLAILAT